MKMVTIRLTDDMNSWILDNFPRGFKQAYINKCFENLRVIVEDGELPPMSEFARLSSIRTLEQSK